MTEKLSFVDVEIGFPIECKSLMKLAMRLWLLSIGLPNLIPYRVGGK